MRKRVTLLTVVALLFGLLAVALPGTALQTDEGADQPLASQSQGQSMVENSALAGAFLQALADKLGVSVEQLKEALIAAKDEVIGQRLGEAVQAGRLAPERAQRLQKRLSQAEPRELLKLLLEQRERRGLAERQAPFGRELKRGRLIGERWQQPGHYMPPYYPSYYQPYSYNCVCYCSFPGYFTPTPLQPQPMMPWKLQQPKPQSPGPQTPQKP